MHFLSFICFFFFIAIIQSESTLNCEELGFTDKLECSSCDKLSAYVSNDGIRLYTVIGWIYSIDLIDECQKTYKSIGYKLSVDIVKYDTLCANNRMRRNDGRSEG